MFSRLTRQRARRLAWRGRSSSASLRAWSLRLRRSAVTRPSGGGAGVGYGTGRRIAHRDATVGSFPQRSSPEDMDARDKPPAFSAACCEVFPRIEELEGGTGRPALADGPRRHRTRNRTRGRKLHHKAAGCDDDKAAHGGLAGRSTRSTALWTERGIRATVASPSSPSMAKRAATIPF